MYIYCIRLQINKHVCLSVCLSIEYPPPPPGLFPSHHNSHSDERVLTFPMELHPYQNFSFKNFYLLDYGHLLLCKLQSCYCLLRSFHVSVGQRRQAPIGKLVKRDVSFNKAVIISSDEELEFDKGE